MTEITVRFQTEKNEVDPAFFVNLNQFAQQYGLQVEEALDPGDSVQIVREGRDWLDRRNTQRAEASGGVQSDLSHLDRMRG